MSKIYGYSDDVVVIEHDDGGCTEIDCYNQNVSIQFNDGTVANIGYGKGNKGIWKIEIDTSGWAEFDIAECEDENAEIYSDVLEIDAEAVSWSALEE